MVWRFFAGPEPLMAGHGLYQRPDLELIDMLRVDLKWAVEARIPSNILQLSSVGNFD